MIVSNNCTVNNCISRLYCQEYPVIIKLRQYRNELNSQCAQYISIKNIDLKSNTALIANALNHWLYICNSHVACFNSTANNIRLYTVIQARIAMLSGSCWSWLTRLVCKSMLMQLVVAKPLFEPNALKHFGSVLVLHLCITVYDRKTISLFSAF